MRWTLDRRSADRDRARRRATARACCAQIADDAPVPLRIGANLGVVFVGDMGHPQRCTYIVMGDATNLAARLMARAQPGEILAGERLARRVRRDVRDHARSNRSTVKGKRAPVARLPRRPVSATGDVD